MPVMIEKLKKDFFEAEEIDKIITKGQLDVETGIPILYDMIQYVKQDIKTLDEEGGYKTLCEKIKELDVNNIKRKESIKQKWGQPTDSISDRNLKRELLKEDHGKYKQELVLIQEICYRKGWFD